jgi:hypothetical protein
MTRQEEDHVRDVLRFFYPATPVQYVNPELTDLAALMLKEAIEGSHAMDLVPRPAGFIPGAGWLVSQAVQIFWRTHGRRGIYEIVRTQVASAHRFEFDIARMSN